MQLLIFIMEQLKQFYEELLQEASKARFIKAIEGLTDEEKQDFISFFDSHVGAYKREP